MMKCHKKVCLVTPGHISTNPRLVKEAISLDRSGYQVHIVFTQYIKHWSDLDEQLLSLHSSWQYDCLNWENDGLKKKSIRYVSALVQKASRLLFKTFKKAGLSAINRHYKWQLKKAIACKADLYIAHNLAALPVAVAAAQCRSVKCGFDAEDFHRYEETDDATDTNVQLKVFTEDTYFKKLDYLSTSSKLIADEYTNLYSELYPVIILNVFPSSNTPAEKEVKYEAPVKLFWFSQWVGKGRGIEETLKAISSLREYDIELHILGDSFGDDRVYFDELIKVLNLDPSNIVFYPPIPPDTIIPFASQFDIGLATEINQPFNRDICLTNKIFTYIQSGLCVVASDTSAQKAFLNEYPEIGKLYTRGSFEDLASCLDFLISNPDMILAAKRNARQLGKEELNWEVEQQKFISTIESIVQR